MSTEKLLKIKSQIDEAKNKQAEIRGKKTSTEEQMQAKFGVKTVDDAEQELKKRAQELDTMEGDFEKGMKEVESAYNWESTHEDKWFKDIIERQGVNISRTNK